MFKKDQSFSDTIIPGFHVNVDILIMFIFITVCIQSLQVFQSWISFPSVSVLSLSY